VHPIRVRRFRKVTVILLAAWAILALYAITQGMKPDGWVTAALCAIALYVLAVGLFRKAAPKA
jgi:phosphatidylcholine synthase